MIHDFRNQLKTLILKFREILEGKNNLQERIPGDLESRLNQMGIWRNRIMPSNEIQLNLEDKKNRFIIEAYLNYICETGVSMSEAFDEYIKECAYTWFNRLFALRCMESIGIIDPVILQQEAYGGRSLKHRRLTIMNPELCNGEDEGLFALLYQQYSELSEDLPDIFNVDSPAIALQPSVSVIKSLISMLSGQEPINGDFIDEDLFKSEESFGWAYQYWNLEEKDLIYEKTRVNKSKISGKDIIPVTCLYTEPYMVKFLVENSIGAYFKKAHPSSTLENNWEYYIKNQDISNIETSPLDQIKIIDPACGSGHFLLEMFDKLYDMYLFENENKTKEEICSLILNNNLFGIDIDERAIQICKLSLWMKAKNKAPNFNSTHLRDFYNHFVAANIRLPNNKNHIQIFIEKHPENKPLTNEINSIFSALENAHEIGSLLNIDEPLSEAISKLKTNYGYQTQLDDLKSKKELENWKFDLIEKLKVHFNQQAISSDLSQAFLGISVKKGLDLIDLLTIKYDIVLTNPPYMGSKNMSAPLKKYLTENYKEGKNDLYSAFILKALNLVKKNGIISMVTQSSWMFLSSYSEFRKTTKKSKVKKSSKFKGILRDTTINTIVHLGPGAFKEISGEVVNVVMFTLLNASPKKNHRINAIRLIGPKNPSEKDTLLKNTVDQNINNYTIFKPIQNLFLYLPLAPISYWLGDKFIKNMSKKTLANYAKICQGLRTTDNNRFLRYQWEMPADGIRWFNYSKGGKYQKWAGLEWYSVDFRDDGQVIKNLVEIKYPYLNGQWEWVIGSRPYYFKEGLTYTCNCQGSLGIRELPPQAIFDPKGPGIFPDEIDPDVIMATLSTRTISYMLRAICPVMDFNPGYVEKAPIPPQTDWNKIKTIGKMCLNYKKKLVALDIFERTFDPRGFLNVSRSFVNYYKYKYNYISILLVLEGILEKEIINSFNFDDDDAKSIIQETGVPSGWYPNIVKDFDNFLDYAYDVQKIISEYNELKPIYVTEEIKDRIIKNLDKTVNNKGKINLDYADFPLTKYFPFKNIDEIGAYNSFPFESDFEEICSRVKINPLSAYSMILEGIMKDNWHWKSEEVSYLTNKISVLILLSLGHQFPSQKLININDKALKFEEIVPIVSILNYSTILDRLRDICKAYDIEYDALSEEFQSVVGKSLADWIIYDYFKFHLTQFKKRPIVWQLQSTPFSRNNLPAFSCLVYYHNLNKDTLVKIKNQYLEPYLNSLNVELNTFMQSSELSHSQSVRRVNLHNIIEELNEFNEALSIVISEGFNSSKLNDLLKKEKLDSWSSIKSDDDPPFNLDLLLDQEKFYNPNLHDGVRVNIAPIQKYGLLASNVLSKKDMDRAIEDRAKWRNDERNWCREGKLKKPGYW